MRATDEALFARYRKDGDVQALGELFDRRATDLFRLALYLGHHASEAEDLLQATFLSAIEGARHYDGSRPLMPWLIGILANHARRSRRQKQRAVVPELLAYDAVPDPRLEAESSELRASLSAALKTVPQPYRQVLQLHLEHGLTARAIGELLERSAGTVRSQVVRGLELLRRALPVGLAGGLALLLTPGHALAGVRAEVVRHATRLAPQTAAPSAPTAGAAVKVALPLVIVALTAVVSVTVSGRGEPLSITDSAAGAASAEPEVVAAHAFDPGGAAIHERREAVGDDAAATAGIAVRLVTADGAPLPGLVAHVVANPDTADLFLVSAVRSSHRATSDDDGWLRVDGLAPGAYQLWLTGSLHRLNVTLPGPRTREWTLPRPIRVRGNVRLEDGTPIAGADVIASATLGSQDVGMTLATSAADGAFEFAAMPGQLWVWGSAAGRADSTAIRRGSSRSLELVLGPTSGALSVSVVDPAGAPAADAVVGVFDGAAAGTAARAPRFAVTDAEGRVAFDRLAPGEVVVAARAGGAVSRRLERTVGAAGAVGVDLQLERGAVVRGRVTDRAGRPMVGRALFAQTAALRPWSFDNRLHDRLAYTDADGRYELTGLAAEPMRLRLVARSLDRDLENRAVTLAPGEIGNLDWAVDAARLDGRLVGAGAGWTVRAVPLGREGTLLSLHSFEAATDANGVFTFEMPARFERFRLFAAPAGCADPRVLCHASRDVATGEHVEIEVGDRRLVPVRGRLSLPAGIAVSDVLLALERGDAAMKVELAPDGGFTTPPLSTGDYRLVARHDDLGALDRAFCVNGEQLDLGDIVWSEPTLLTVLAPARTRVWLEDEAGNVLAVVAVAEPWPVVPGRHWLCAAGPGLAPQRHALDVVAGKPVTRELRAAGGTPCAFEFCFLSVDNVIDLDVRLHVEVQDAAGAVVVRDSVELAERELFRWQQALAPGEYRLVGTTDWGGTAELDFRVGSSESAPTTVPIATGQ